MGKQLCRAKLCCARGIRPGVDGKSSGKVNGKTEKGREINARSFFDYKYYGRSDEAHAGFPLLDCFLARKPERILAVCFK